MTIKTLSRDKNGLISSQKTIITGENCGWAQPEVNGEWIYLDGYDYETLQVAQSVHRRWAQHLISLGFIIGRFESDGVTNFYYFKENAKCMK